MLNTYIKNSGATQSFIHNNNKNKFSEMNWDSDYDGNVANILVNSNNNGKRRQYNISLDNNDLANLLNVPSVSTPIDKRLRMDFQRPQMIEHNPQALMVHLPYSDETSSYPVDNSYPVAEPFSPLESLTNSPKSYLSSPMLNDEFIVPVTIGKKTTNLGSKKKNKTYQIFKKKKPSSKNRRSSRRSSRSRSRSYRTKTRSSRR